MRLVTKFLCVILSGRVLPLVALADQILYPHEETAAPSVSPTDEICGITANISSCSSIVDWDALDPALYPMLLPNNKVFYAYIRPDVSTFYQENILNTEDASQRKTLHEVKPIFNGMAGRFVNMSPDPMLLIWISDDDEGLDSLISYIDPFEQDGTATYPGHRFCMTPVDDETDCVKLFEVKEGVSRYSYDPFVEDPENNRLEDLSRDQLAKYKRLQRAEDFSRRYRTFTGRDFLSNYPRHRAKHYMYPADYFGQTHTVETKETHFVQIPPKELLGVVPNDGSKRKLLDDEVSFAQSEAQHAILQYDQLHCTYSAFSSFQKASHFAGISFGRKQYEYDVNCFILCTTSI